MTEIKMKWLDQIMPDYKKFLATDGQQWQQERKEKDLFFSEYFSEKAIDGLEEGTLRELIYILWAFHGWTNKDWLLEQMLLSGLPQIRTSFKQLFYGGEDISKRFDSMRKNIKMMGAACISEMLAHHDHQSFPIWNSRSREGLISLGVEASRLPKSSQISGSQYVSFCELTDDIRNKIAEKYPEISDLFQLDFLLYFISLKKLRPDMPKLVPEPAAEDFDHDAVINQVLELGDGLGFEVQKEFSLMHGCRIDALWRSRVANLGTIAYAFEVHRKGSRDSAILNLQRVRRDPTIQKVVVISNEEELEKFRKEIASLDEGFRTSVGYFDVQDLQLALDHLQTMKEILKGLGLLNVEGAIFGH